MRAVAFVLVALAGCALLPGLHAQGGNPCAQQPQTPCICYNTIDPPACYDPKKFTCQNRVNLVPGSEPSGSCPATSIAPGQRIGLQGSNGNFLARCRGCNPGANAPDQAFVHEKVGPGSGDSTWTVLDAGGGKIALESNNNNLLNRCTGCIPNARYPDAGMVAVTGPPASNPTAVFTVEDAGAGKIALKADNGKYLELCSNCAPGAAYPDQTFFFSDTITPNAAWMVVG